MSRTASDAGLTRLYHYEGFKPAYLEDLLVHHRVHCSDPAKLNDPWDCRPWFSPPAAEDSETVEALVDWIFSFTPTEPSPLTAVNATREKLLANSKFLRTQVEEFSKKFVELILEKHGLYCLTPIPNSTLMWSHYAENHHGICLEFAVDNPVFMTAQEVTYRSEYPLWSPALGKEGRMALLLTKSDDWSYEREYRVIGIERALSLVVDDHPLMMDNRFIRLPNGALRAVIVGCEANIERISELVSTSSTGVQVKRAVRSPSRYKLEIV